MILQAPVGKTIKYRIFTQKIGFGLIKTWARARKNAVLPKTKKLSWVRRPKQAVLPRTPENQAGVAQKERVRELLSGIGVIM
jgi:hypothetical protein